MLRGKERKKKKRKNRRRKAKGWGEQDDSTELQKPNLEADL